MMAYQWNSSQTDANAVPDGVVNASGTPHDIPSQKDCGVCHNNMKDRVLGFTAIQLSHNKPGVTLDKLIQSGALTNPPAAAFQLPGNATEQAALGYLHANCGMCHNDNSIIATVIDMRLWLSTSALGAVSDTPTYKTTVGVATDSPVTPSTVSVRIQPGDPSASAIHLRMSDRGSPVQMPPLGTELVDSTGVAAVDAWINSLP